MNVLRFIITSAKLIIALVYMVVSFILIVPFTFTGIYFFKMEMKQLEKICAYQSAIFHVILGSKLKGIKNEDQKLQD